VTVAAARVPAMRSSTTVLGFDDTSGTKISALGLVLGPAKAWPWP